MVLWVVCCCSLSHTATKKAVTVTEERVEITSHAMTLRRCNGAEVTLAVWSSSVFMGKFIGCIKSVVMEGNSTLTLPCRTTIPNTKEETDVVLYDERMKQRDGDEEDCRVCTYNEERASFVEPECDGTQKDHRRLVLTASHRSVNAKTALVWRSREVVPQGETPPTMMNENQMFKVGVLTVHGAVSLVVDMDIELLTIFSERQSDFHHGVNLPNHLFERVEPPLHPIEPLSSKGADRPVEKTEPLYCCEWSSKGFELAYCASPNATGTWVLGVDGFANHFDSVLYLFALGNAGNCSRMFAIETHNPSPSKMSVLPLIETIISITPCVCCPATDAQQNILASLKNETGSFQLAEIMCDSRIPVNNDSNNKMCDNRSRGRAECRCCRKCVSTAALPDLPFAVDSTKWADIAVAVSSMIEGHSTTPSSALVASVLTLSPCMIALYGLRDKGRDSGHQLCRLVDSSQANDLRDGWGRQHRPRWRVRSQEQQRRVHHVLDGRPYNTIDYAASGALIQALRLKLVGKKAEKKLKFGVRGSVVRTASDRTADTGHIVLTRCGVISRSNACAFISGKAIFLDDFDDWRLKDPKRQNRNGSDAIMDRNGDRRRKHDTGKCIGHEEIDNSKCHDDSCTALELVVLNGNCSACIVNTDLFYQHNQHHFDKDASRARSLVVLRGRVFRVEILCPHRRGVDRHGELPVMFTTHVYSTSLLAMIVSILFCDHNVPWNNVIVTCLFFSSISFPHSSL